MRPSTIRAFAFIVSATSLVAIAGAQYSLHAASPAAIRSSAVSGAILGAADGLYRVDQSGTARKLLAGTDVRKILRTGDGWYLLSGWGVLFSRDLATFEKRNAGIPVKVLKTWDGSSKGFTREIQEIKDLEIDPYDPLTMVACTKDAVYVTRDGALSWTSIPSPAIQPGLKAVAVTSKPDGLVFASHPIKGMFSRPLSGGAWREIGGDLGRSDPGTGPDEISDIVVEATDSGTNIWAANSFLPGLYRYDFQKRSFASVWKGSEDFAAYDSLMPRRDGLYFVTDGAVMRQARPGTEPASVSTERAAVLAAASLLSSQLNALWMEGSSGQPLVLSELWLVSFKSDKPYRAVADGRHGFYLQTGFMVNEESRAKYDAFMTERNLDMIVVDLKDDFGRLRFEPRDPLVRSTGRWVNPLDVEGFVTEMKAKGRYLVARIVVFKDKHLYESAGGAYAVWDGKENAPWKGYIDETRELPVPTPPGAPPSSAAPATTLVTERKYFDEYWVDPYSEKVWEYNVAIAREIIARGFDEVQFDYIRFPTDGVNLGDARFRWRDQGMDMESALMSYLDYARDHIAAPISLDIYGANGWYRSGVRTGQDVELLSRYVDVFCPMFYPSHFEQDFMAFEPAVLRPYRIYRIGTLRNSYISRKKTVIRPYVQAFFLNVRYDRLFYNPNYVSLQVNGIRDARNEGLTFWNNSGRYEDIPVLKTDRNGKLTARLSNRSVMD
ncbi:MAG: hypothetical protein E4H20_09010 [Spirochaetales bacterium]|nr:MAG: hypothetical protein E4H20_09010 [Spirochaetales bacterium]